MICAEAARTTAMSVQMSEIKKVDEKFAPAIKSILTSRIANACTAGLFAIQVNLDAIIQQCDIKSEYQKACYCKTRELLEQFHYKCVINHGVAEIRW